MLRLVVAGMALVIIVLAGITGFLAYEQLNDEDDGATPRGQPTPEQPTGWDTVSYQDKHDICHEFATQFYGEGRAWTDDDKYQACMKCGPAAAYAVSTGGGSEIWVCPP